MKTEHTPLHETQDYLAEIIAERDRLKAANAEMMELLKSFTPLQENGALDHIWSALISHQERHYADALRQWGNEARAVIAKAEAL